MTRIQSLEPTLERKPTLQLSFNLHTWTVACFCVHTHAHHKIYKYRKQLYFCDRVPLCTSGCLGSLCGPHRVPEQPQLNNSLTAALASRRSSNLFWSPHAPETHVAHLHAHRQNTHPHKTKMENFRSVWAVDAPPSVCAQLIAHWVWRCKDQMLKRNPNGVEVRVGVDGQCRSSWRSQVKHWSLCCQDSRKKQEEGACEGQASRSNFSSAFASKSNIL